MLVRVYAFIHYPKLPDCVSTLSAYFYFIALKDKSIMVKCKRVKHRNNYITLLTKFRLLLSICTDGNLHFNLYMLL